MENRNNILNELREISPVVAGIGHQVPYSVPAGYFEGLADQLLQLVKADEANAPVLPKAINPYQVPQGYFEGLADNILQRVKATATDNASDELEIISPFLSQIDKKMPFSTPAGYFDELGENAIAGAQAIDFVNGTLENLSPLMSGLRRMYVYEVPAGYFEQLPGEVLKAVKAHQPARVVSMSFTRRVIRYAAAAVVAGLIITAGWLYVGNRSIKDPNGFPPKDLANISDELLEKYLENQTPTAAETAIAAIDNNDEIDANDMKDMLADVSDEDLQQYIEKYSTEKSIQTN